MSVHKSRTFEAETERGKDDLIRAQYAPGIKRPSPGVNKKPFTCSFQDRPFQNPETLETCDRQFWTNATKRRQQLKCNNYHMMERTHVPVIIVGSS